MHVSLRRAATLVVACAALLAPALPAAAHVTVSPGTSTQGADEVLAFRVPSELDNATTVKVQLYLPVTDPIPTIALKPLAGWTAVVHTTKLAAPVQTDDGPVSDVVSDVTWTADPGSVLQPGQFQEFDVSAGPLPKVSELDFKVLQTYSDGSVVRWIDPTPPGGPEPDHPAPVLHLTAAAAGDVPPAAPASAPSVSATGVTAAASPAKTDSARGLAIGALVVASLALLAGIGAVLRGPRLNSGTGAGRELPAGLKQPSRPDGESGSVSAPGAVGDPAVYEGEKR